MGQLSVQPGRFQEICPSEIRRTVAGSHRKIPYVNFKNMILNRQGAYSSRPWREARGFDTPQPALLAAPLRFAFPASRKVQPSHPGVVSQVEFPLSARSSHAFRAW
jgi:hypothetical protein